MNYVKNTLIVVGALVALLVVIVIINVGRAANREQQSSQHVSQSCPNLACIQEGMTETEVARKLGKPDNTITSTFDGTTTSMWVYGTLSSVTYDITFADGAVESFGAVG